MYILTAQSVANLVLFHQMKFIQVVCEHKECLYVGFYSIFRTKALVLELLAAVCLVRGGHEIILSAFDNFKEVSKSTF